MRKTDRPIAAAFPGTLLPTTIQGRVLNPDISIFGFNLKNRSKKFAARLETGRLDFTPRADTPSRPRKARRDASASRQLRVSAQLA
jgi:hypothetical protein